MIFEAGKVRYIWRIYENAENFSEFNILIKLLWYIQNLDYGLRSISSTKTSLIQILFCLSINL